MRDYERAKGLKRFGQLLSGSRTKKLYNAVKEQRTLQDEAYKRRFRIGKALDHRGKDPRNSKLHRSAVKETDALGKRAMELWDAAERENRMVRNTRLGTGAGVLGVPGIGAGAYAYGKKKQKQASANLERAKGLKRFGQLLSGSHYKKLKEGFELRDKLYRRAMRNLDNVETDLRESGMDLLDVFKSPKFKKAREAERKQADRAGKWLDKSLDEKHAVRETRLWTGIGAGGAGLAGIGAGGAYAYRKKKQKQASIVQSALRAFNEELGY